MIAQWDNECILLADLSVAQVQFLAVAECFKGFFPYLPMRAESAWQIMALSSPNGAIQLVDLEEEGSHPTTDGQWRKNVLTMEANLV